MGLKGTISILLGFMVWVGLEARERVGYRFYMFLIPGIEQTCGDICIGIINVCLSSSDLYDHCVSAWPGDWEGRPMMLLRKS